MLNVILKSSAAEQLSIKSFLPGEKIMYQIYNLTTKMPEFTVTDDLAEDAVAFMNESFSKSTYRAFEIPHFKSYQEMENGI